MLLEQSRIREICNAVVEMNLVDQRKALFAGLPTFTNRIQATNQGAAQLLIDLDTLNNRPEAYAGEVSPLETWLENTLLLCQGDPRAKVLAGSLHTLKSKRSNSTQPPPEQVSHTSVVIDRIEQWRTLLSRCESSDEHLAFVVHAEPKQHLSLFIRRIQSFFKDHKDKGGCARTHHIVRIERSDGYHSATTADEWQRALIKASVAKKGELDFVFVQESKTHQRPILFLLVDNDGPLRELDAPGAKELGNFFKGRINAALSVLEQRKALRHPLRFIIPVEHSPTDKNSRAHIQTLADALGRAPSLRAEVIKELSFPPWNEVHDYIEKEFGPNEELLQACQDIYTSNTGSVLDLGEALHAFLMDWEEQHF